MNFMYFLIPKEKKVQIFRIGDKSPVSLEDAVLFVETPIEDLGKLWKIIPYASFKGPSSLAASSWYVRSMYVLILKKLEELKVEGRCPISLYNETGRNVASFELEAG